MTATNESSPGQRLTRVLMTIVAATCASCGAAETVDEVVGRPTEPQAVSRLRSCPEFGWWLMLPKTPAVGDPAEIVVNVSDQDTPLDKIAFNWVATAGEFSAPQLLQTSFTCHAEGHQTLALVARDDTDCERVLDIQITCFPP